MVQLTQGHKLSLKTSGSNLEKEKEKLSNPFPNLTFSQSCAGTCVYRVTAETGEGCSVAKFEMLSFTILAAEIVLMIKLKHCFLNYLIVSSCPRLNNWFVNSSDCILSYMVEM